MNSIVDINSIYKVSNKEKYWLFRAGDKARFFKNFYSTERIGIAWDRINKLEQIQNYDILKSEVERLYPEENRPGNIYNKIYKFVHEMQIGDIIIMPDSEKKRVAFGRIVSNEIIIKPIIEQKQLLFVKKDFEESSVDPGAINKYKKVQWLKIEPKEKLSGKLLVHLFSPHSISKLSNEIKYEINKILNDVFVINNQLYLRYKVNTQENVYADDIWTFYNLIKSTEKIINILSDKEEKIETKINVASPGDIIAILTFSILGLCIINYMLNGGFVKIKYKDKFDLEIGGGKTLYDYIEQNHRHKLDKKKIEEIEKVLENTRNNISEEAFQRMLKNLDLDLPKLEEKKDK